MSTDVPLPEPSAYAPQMITEDAYTADQMRSYGDARSAKAKAEVAALRKALKPFADADLTSPVVRDTFGFDVLRARAALQEQKS